MQAREKLEVLRRDIDEGLRQRDSGDIIDLSDAEAQRTFFDRIKSRGSTGTT